MRDVSLLPVFCACALVPVLAACEPDALTQSSMRADAAMRMPDDPGERPVDPPPVHQPSPDAGTSSMPDSGPPPSFPDASSPAADASTPPPMETDAGPPPMMRECYTEPFDPTLSIADLESSFNGGNGFELAREALQRRYPAAYDLLIAEQNDPYTGSFTDNSSFDAAMESAMTEAHEGTHGWDYEHALFEDYFGYWLRSDLTPQLRFTVNGFPRSELYAMLEDNSTDLYSGLYLTGDQGTRGLIELLDEMNAYINGLGALTAIGDHVPLGISGRDGAVAFLYYLELYIRRARTDYPDLYMTMRGDAVLKELVKTQWLRTHFFLIYADMRPQLGIDDAQIRTLLYAPANISEISMLIGRCVDQTNCLCD